MGRVRGVHGLRGMVRVEPLTDNPSRFDAGRTLHPEGTDDRLTVVSAHRDGPGLLVRFAEIKDRPTADRLREVFLEAEPEPLPESSYYWHDIIGCAVVTTSGEDLGTVQDIFRVGESEVYVANGPRGEMLIPAVASIVTELAPKDGRIVVDAVALGLDAE